VSNSLKDARTSHPCERGAGFLQHFYRKFAPPDFRLRPAQNPCHQQVKILVGGTTCLLTKSLHLRLAL
jgi:hypothetical protein